MRGSTVGLVLVCSSIVMLVVLPMVMGPCRMPCPKGIPSSPQVRSAVLRPLRVAYGIFSRQEDVELRRAWREVIIFRNEPKSAVCSFYFVIASLEPSKDLQAEQEKHGDLVLLNGMTENMNNGKTLLYFATMAEKDFDFVIKTDLDTFPNLSMLEEEVLKMPRRACYAGYSLGFVACGKMSICPRDHMYMAGELYLLSRDLCQYIARGLENKSIALRGSLHEDIRTAEVLYAGPSLNWWTISRPRQEQLWSHNVKGEESIRQFAAKFLADGWQSAAAGQKRIGKISSRMIRKRVRRTTSLMATEAVAVTTRAKSVAKSLPPTIAPLRIAVLSMVCRAIPRIPRAGSKHHQSGGFSFPSLPNRVHYAVAHNYTLLIEGCGALIPDHTPVWGKISTLIRHLPNFDYVIWVDNDAVIANASVAVESLLAKAEPHKSDLYITKDFNGYNFGVFIMRNSPFSFDLLQSILSVEPLRSTRHWFQEQEALITCLDRMDSASFEKHVHVLEQRDMNAYPSTAVGVSAEAQYKLGDFIVHFAGCTSQTRRDCHKEWDAHILNAKQTKSIPPGALIFDYRECCIDGSENNGSSCATAQCSPPKFVRKSIPNEIHCIVMSDSVDLGGPMFNDAANLCAQWSVFAQKNSKTMLSAKKVPSSVSFAHYWGLPASTAKESFLKDIGSTDRRILYLTGGDFPRAELRTVLALGKWPTFTSLSETAYLANVEFVEFAVQNIANGPLSILSHELLCRIAIRLHGSSACGFINRTALAPNKNDAAYLKEFPVLQEVELTPVHVLGNASNRQEAYATMVTQSSGSYFDAAVALVYALKKFDPTRAVLVITLDEPENYSPLQQLGANVVQVKSLGPRYSNPSAQKRYTKNWSKLNLWRFEELYSRIFYIDADVYVRASPGAVFKDCPSGSSLCAVQDTGLREGYFNAGVFMLTPSENTYQILEEQMNKLTESVLRHSTFRFAEQDLMNNVFARVWTPLPYKYNAQWYKADSKVALQDLVIVHDKFWTKTALNPALVSLWKQLVDEAWQHLKSLPSL